MDTVYISIFMNITSFYGILVNVTENHNIYFWYKIPESVSQSEFQDIELSYKKVTKSWNKVHLSSYTEINSLKWIAFSFFDATIRCFDACNGSVSKVIQLNSIAHTLRSFHGEDKLIIFCYSKNFEVIEINQYYKESKVDLKGFGHIS